jgi:GMP synthase (glutamine-hydrolysing)
MANTLAVLDFGSQYSQLITRRLREAGVYAELFPWNKAAADILALAPAGFVLSGGPNSVYEQGAPQVPAFVLDSGLPVLGICYGMQALTHTLGGVVAPSAAREYGPAQIEITQPNSLLLDDQYAVWMSHGDRIESPPPGFIALARSDHSPIAAMGDEARGYYGVQFHPEVHHTPHGLAILRAFAVEVCGLSADWTPAAVIDPAVAAVQAQVGGQRVLSAVSGGVDSAVATALVHKAVGDQLVAVFVDHGLLRFGEAESVVRAFRNTLGAELLAVAAQAEFFAALKGQTDPEAKRTIIGEKFIRIFEREARALGQPPFLVQGTIYPDVIESRAPEREHAQRIKTHHNVGGLPEDLQFQLVEPLRYLFKDEVRTVGEALGLPPEMVWRQPFPGPGLAVRCLGEVTPERIARLQAADHILTTELEKAGLLRQRYENGDLVGSSQAFVVLLPVRSVGVMGDNRTYQEVAAIRAVTTEDFMTADFARLPLDLLGQIANTIVNTVDGINRVTYDISSKPPATIEWE